MNPARAGYAKHFARSNSHNDDYVNFLELFRILNPVTATNEMQDHTRSTLRWWCLRPHLGQAHAGRGFGHGDHGTPKDIARGGLRATPSVQELLSFGRGPQPLGLPQLQTSHADAQHAAPEDDACCDPPGGRRPADREYETQSHGGRHCQDSKLTQGALKRPLATKLRSEFWISGPSQQVVRLSLRRELVLNLRIIAVRPEPRSETTSLQASLHRCSSMSVRPRQRRAARAREREVPWRSPRARRVQGSPVRLFGSLGGSFLSDGGPQSAETEYDAHRSFLLVRRLKRDNPPALRRGTNAVTGPRPDKAYLRAWRFPRRASRGASHGNWRPTRTLRQQREGGCGRQRPRSREPLSVQS
jgi:hypothetical protein